MYRNVQRVDRPSKSGLDNCRFQKSDVSYFKAQIMLVTVNTTLRLPLSELHSTNGRYLKMRDERKKEFYCALQTDESVVPQ